MDNECKARCVGMDCKRRRRMMAKLRGGTAELGIEIGRWHGLRREDRVCKECGRGEVEDTEHFVMRCAYVVKERKRLENLMSSRVKGWHELAENEKVLRIMDRACCDEAVARAVESLWKKRFVADVPVPMKQVFRVKKLVGRQWGAPNSNYLLVIRPVRRGGSLGSYEPPSSTCGKQKSEPNHFFSSPRPYRGIRTRSVTYTS